MRELEYPLMIRPLSVEDGGGYFVEFPDLPGCVADGNTIEEVISAAKDAMRSWVATATEFGDTIARPPAKIGRSKTKPGEDRNRARIAKKLA